MSQPISPNMQNMLADGYQLAPSARLKIDIDPPFVGVDFMADACDPSLHEWGGVLYLTFIDSTAGAIKIGVIDQTAMKVTSLLRTIQAPNSRRPRLCFEPSTYPGKPDLPHIAYDDTDTGKAMIYREEYDSQGNVEVISDEIGNGSNAETVRSGNTIIDFYISEGVLYSRVQGEYAQAIIDNTDASETVTSARAMALPDTRIAILYTVVKSDGTNEIRVSYSEMIGGKVIDDSFSISLAATGIIFSKPYSYDEGFLFSISIEALSLITNVFNFDNEGFQFALLAQSIQLIQNGYSLDESFNFSLSSTGIRMDLPHSCSENFYFTLYIRNKPGIGQLLCSDSCTIIENIELRYVDNRVAGCKLNIAETAFRYSAE
jgi:hypothetical protein